jgi:hypothetical protein
MVTIVTPAAYSNPCAEVWVDPATLSTPDPTLAEEAAVSATWALWRLSGERFHGPQCWIEDYRTIRGYCQIQLDQWPVDTVYAVSRIDLCANTVGATGVGELVDSWCDQGNGLIKVCCGNSFSACGCSSGGSVVRVHYTTKNNLPPGADRAAYRLAEEYVKASLGQACALPERVTSINRQGASWTILDPQDFLQDGLTGIGPIDQWLAQVGTRNTWVKFTDPLKSVPLVSSTIVGCGEDDCFSSLSP